MNFGTCCENNNSLNIPVGPQGIQGIPGNNGVDGKGYDATSSNSISVLDNTNTTINVTITTNKAYLPGTRVRFTTTSNLSNYFEGIVNTYNALTGAIEVINIDLKRGSGTHSSWNVNSTGENSFNIYDSGWKVMNSHNGTFGFAPVVGWTNPSIRVVGKIVFITGRVLIPLAQTGASTTLRTPFSDYQSPYNVDVQTYTGTDGGYNVNPYGVMISKSSILPTVLAPNQTMFLGQNVFSQRNILDTGNTHVITLNTVFGSVRLDTDGKLNVISQKDADDSVGTAIGNFPVYKLITRADSGANVPSYSSYKEQIGGFSITDSTKTYPTAIDANEPAQWGGFSFTINLCYPIDSTYTEADIIAAFDSI